MTSHDRPPIRVLCVDDNADVASLLRVVINAEADMENVGAISEPDRVLDEVTRVQPDIVVLDLSMPGHNALDLVGKITAASPQTRCIMYSGYDDVHAMDQAVDAGAWGFVSKHQDAQKLVAAIRQVAQGQMVLAG